MAFNQENKIQLELIKYNLFKEQNPETGRYDVMFEVEGKLLYAHKLMLTLVSDTFDSMLSDRWAKKDVPVKIESFTYSNFYHFLTFLYTGQCQLMDANILAMVDLAEFYGVDLFKKYCDVYLSAMVITAENVFPMIELAEKYSLNQLKTALHGFITNNFRSFYYSEGFLKADKSFIEGLVAAVKDKINSEELFQAVFKWCEKQARDKQSADPSLNLNDTVKTEISGFLAHIHFERMERKFFNEFVVSRGFIFSYSELSKILCDRDNYGETKIKITNYLNQTLHGYLIPDETVLKHIESLKLSTSSFGSDTNGYWNKQCKIPPSPSPLKKKDGIQWYLIFYSIGYLGIKRGMDIDEDHYLLAELTAKPSGFDTAAGCKIEI